MAAPRAPSGAVEQIAHWAIEDVRQWLANTLAVDGVPLERHLEGGSFDAQLNRSVAAYASGEWSFSVALDQVRVQVAPALLQKLHTGISMGAITGAVINAYPPVVDVESWVRKALCAASDADRQRATDTILDMSDVEFLIRHFQRRGGLVSDLDQRLAMWTRFRSTGGNDEPLCDVVHTCAYRAGLPPYRWFDRFGYPSTHWRELQRAVVTDLVPRPKLRDVAGTASLTFTDVRQDAEPRGTLVGAEGLVAADAPRFFQELLREKVDLLTPAEFLALTTATSDPLRPYTYPAQTSGEWLAGMTEDAFAWAYSESRRDGHRSGLTLSWKRPHETAQPARARSAIRCHASPPLTVV